MDKQRIELHLHTNMSAMDGINTASEYVNDALDQGWVSTGGAYITKLEQEMANFLHTQEVAACQSGTAGLHLSLVDAGVEPNDMVIVPTLTFIAIICNTIKYSKRCN